VSVRTVSSGCAAECEGPRSVDGAITVGSMGLSAERSASEVD
jgi:hypothetical protein